MEVQIDGQIFILNFHGLGAPGQGLALEAGEEAYWIEASFFGAILDLVRDRADVKVTFDDSNESDFTVAFPALQSRGMKARFFMVAGRIGRPGYVSLTQLRSMLKAGMEIGSHGMRHRPWRGLPQADLDEELIEAKDRLEQMAAQPISAAACPWGSYDRRVLGALRKSGYQRVYTSDQGPASPGAWFQPRSSIMRKHDLPRVKSMVATMPHGLPGMWRTVKLALKRWR
jgi:peptidoglycan/xylan/chitin deacetylase (PgdA/CDA1 family)